MPEDWDTLWSQYSCGIGAHFRSTGTHVSVRCVVVEGVHLEGPFISREKKGAHDESLIVPSLSSGMDDVRRVYGSVDNASIVTLAPELPGAVDVIRQLTSLGITVSLGNLSCVTFPSVSLQLVL